MQNKTTNLERLKDTQTYKHTYVSVYARIKSKRINLFFGAGVSQQGSNMATTIEPSIELVFSWLGGTIVKLHRIIAQPV